jgi:cytochrome P450
MSMSTTLEYFEEHYDPYHPDLAEKMWDVVEHLRARCPVAHSDSTMRGSATNGLWVLTNYEDIVSVLRDPETFSSDSSRFNPEHADDPLGYFPPISLDPPLHQKWRVLLNPRLTPKALASYEPGIRAIVTELIDGFIEAGHCDFVSQLAKLLPSRMFFQVLFGIDDKEEVDRCLVWSDKVIYEQDGSPEFLAAMAAWVEWIAEFVSARRAGPRREDLIDSLLFGTIDGQPLSDRDITGAIQILTLGAFETTSDALSAVMLKLTEFPEVQARLRSDPSLIPGVFDEILRVETPVITLSRHCTRDVEIGGQQLKTGDMILMHFGAANRDPTVFENPTECRWDRAENRHIAFGLGPHRCIGSNTARLNLRVVFEEVLARLDDIRVTSGDGPTQAPATMTWGLKYLPISFVPRPLVGA